MTQAKEKILIVEDEGLFAKAISKRLVKAGYTCEIAGTLQQARQMLKDFAPDMMTLDMRLPDGNGLELLAEVRAEDELIPVLVMTAYGELDDAVSAMKMKASDYLKKPVDLDELQLNIEKVLSKAHLSRQLEFSRKRESHASEGVEFIGEAAQIEDIRSQVQRIGQLCPDIDTIPPTMLILGETGTGKDVVARLLHSHSRRSGRPFVQMDCAALPRDLIEAELFGHEKGAFTNASSARIGLVEAAEDGVLFIDEIGELPLELQAKLLATLERRTLRRVGSNQERPVKAWFISATNRDLEQMVRDGEFRSDLYYRLNVLSLAMPPLRQRGKDIERLARTFCEQNTRRYGLQPVELTEDAVQALHAYAWPGNVRELKHSMEQAVLLSGGGRIDASAFMFNHNVSSIQGGGISNQQLQGMTLDAAEYQLIKAALERTHNNVSESARQLGVTRMAMRYRMKKYRL